MASHSAIRVVSPCHDPENLPAVLAHLYLLCRACSAAAIEDENFVYISPQDTSFLTPQFGHCTPSGGEVGGGGSARAVATDSRGSRTPGRIAGVGPGAAAPGDSFGRAARTGRGGPTQWYGPFHFSYRVIYLEFAFQLTH